MTVAAMASERVDRQTTRNRVIANSAASVISCLLYLPIAFLLSRYIVHRIGLRDFGLWAGLTMLVGFGGLLDLGISTPVTRHVAEYGALGRVRDLNALLSTALVIYLAIGLGIAFLLLAASGWVLAGIFHSPNDDLLPLYLATLVGLVLSLSSNALTSLIAGLQRTDLNAWLNLAGNLVQAGGAVLALERGYGLTGLVISWLASLVLATAAGLLVARSIFPQLSLNPLLFDRAILRRIFAFSSKVQVTNLTLFLNDQLDRTLIAYVLGPISLGFFQLAQRAAATITYACTALTQGLLPATADLEAAGDGPRLRDLHLRATRYLAVAVFGLCAGMGGFALPLVRLWLGPGYDRVAISIMILVCGYTVWLPCQATTAALNGIGRPDIRLRADLAFLALHVPLCAGLLWRFGYFGGMAGTAFALSITRVPIYIFGSRALGTPLLHLLRTSLVAPLLCAMLALGPVILFQLVWANSPVLAVLPIGLIFSLAYGAFTWWLALDQYDRRLLSSIRSIWRPYEYLGESVSCR